jgi:hypothetical protein
LLSRQQSRHFRPIAALQDFFYKKSIMAAIIAYRTYEQLFGDPAANPLGTNEDEIRSSY